jgi:hypothetical protein
MISLIIYRGYSQWLFGRWSRRFMALLKLLIHIPDRLKPLADVGFTLRVVLIPMACQCRHRLMDMVINSPQLNLLDRLRRCIPYDQFGKFLDKRFELFWKFGMKFNIHMKPAFRTII